jgi:hypothetical protein
MLNPVWYEGMLKHGFEGVRNIESHVTNTMGWSATTGEVAPWVYQRIGETFVLDADMRERLATLNPKSAARVANRLIEASDRNSGHRTRRHSPPSTPPATNLKTASKASPRWRHKETSWPARSPVRWPRWRRQPPGGPRPQ